jgi:hypothetical protein
METPPPTNGAKPTDSKGTFSHGLHVKAQKKFFELQYSGCPMREPLECEFHDWDTDPYNDENPELAGDEKRSPVVSLYNRLTRGAEIHKAVGMVARKKSEQRKNNKKQEIDICVIHERGYPTYGFAQEMDFGKAPSLFKNLKGGILVRYSGYFFRGFYASLGEGEKPAIVQIYQEETKSKTNNADSDGGEPRKKAKHILTFEGGYEPGGRTGPGKIIVNEQSVGKIGYSSFDGVWKDGGMLEGEIKADLPDKVWKYTGKFNTTGRNTDGKGTEDKKISPEKDGKMEITYKDKSMGKFVYKGSWWSDVPKEGKMEVFDETGKKRFEYEGFFEEEDGLFETPEGKESILTREPDDPGKKSVYKGGLKRGKFEGYGNQEQLVSGTVYKYAGNHHIGMRHDDKDGKFLFDDHARLAMKIKKGGCCFTKTSGEGASQAERAACRLPRACMLSIRHTSCSSKRTVLCSAGCTSTRVDSAPIRRSGLCMDLRGPSSKPDRYLQGPWMADNPVTGHKELFYKNEYGDKFKVRFDEDNQVKPPGCRLGCDFASIAGGVICAGAFGFFGLSSFGLCNVGREPPGKTPTKLTLLQAWRLMAVSEPWGMQGSELPRSSNLLLKWTAPPPVEGVEENPDHYIRSLPETTYLLPEDPDPVKAVNRMIKAASTEKKEDPKDFGMLPFDLWFQEFTKKKAKKKKGMATRVKEFGNNLFGGNEAPEEAETPRDTVPQQKEGDLAKSRTQLEGEHSQSAYNTLGAEAAEAAPVVEEAAAAGALRVQKALYGWADDLWGAELGSGDNHAGGATDVTEIVRGLIVNDELHINPNKEAQYMNRTFWPETATGPPIPRKLGVRYAYGDGNFEAYETPAVPNETVALHVTRAGASDSP